MAERFDEARVLALARAAYESGVASFDIDRDSCALLVIDMQDEFVRPGWTPYWVPEATRLAPRLQEVVTAARSRSVPVIYTAFAATHRGLDRPATGPLMPNRFPGVEHDERWFREGRIWEEVAPDPDDIVLHKPSYGAFYDTPLVTILRNLGRDTVIVTGTLTNYCCGMTARQAYERGFKVVVVSDLTAADDPELQDPELRVLRKGFARIVSSAELLALLAIDSGHRD
jgi:nicotinamidase-related amidase